MEEIKERKINILYLLRLPELPAGPDIICLTITGNLQVTMIIL